MHIASISFGKDSLATVLLAIQHHEPLDRCVFAEVMYDHERGISGEIPEHIEWIYSTAIPKLKNMGVKIDIVRSDIDYLYYFRTRVRGGGKFKGQFYGFPIGGKCVINRECKLRPIHEYCNSLLSPVTVPDASPSGLPVTVPDGSAVGIPSPLTPHPSSLIPPPIIQYVGIAADEPKRLARLKSNQASLLAKYGITEAMAKEMCREAGLLSPIYKTGTRGGCWFCPNARISSLRLFRKTHPDLWQELLALGKTPNLCSYGFKYGTTIDQLEQRFRNEELQLSIF